MGEVAWSPVVAGLRLGGAADGDTVTFTLQNAGRAELTVLSHVDVGEIHLDWYAVQLDGDRTLRFLADRDESAVERARLAPGQSLTHTVDLRRWAGRPVNGGAPLPTGPLALRCRYDVDAATAATFGGVWSGSLTTPQFG
ncbi:hypothetical protein [Krasilnikovia sp. MM14-A1004]|uniref:hypothetical protein n=1 Tax=Krasilnikovia sp. MM14-A1004 TaxID=3373541 RepID=UPI00399C5593